MSDGPAVTRPSHTVVFAHGFTQTGSSWEHFLGQTSEHLAPASWRLDPVRPDMPGHGTASEVSGDLWAAGQRLLDAADAVTADIVGYSMGGRMALHAALTAPHRVNSLVLIGATAGIDDPWERQQRRVADDALADRIEAIGIEAFLTEWLAKPLFASLDPRAADVEGRLTNTAAGLASSLRTCGTGTQEPLWTRLSDIACPVLVIAGELDAKFTSIGRRMVSRLGNAEIEIVDGAGHAVHLEQPDAVAAIVADFLDRQHAG